MADKIQSRRQVSNHSQVSQSVNLSAFAQLEGITLPNSPKLKRSLNLIDGSKQQQNIEILNELKKQRAAMRLHQINQQRMQLFENIRKKAGDVNLGGETAGLNSLDMKKPN